MLPGGSQIVHNPMITVFELPPAFGAPSLSPFCTKVETYLRMTGRDYRSLAADPRRGPKSKVPWIDDEGTIVGDSEFILAHCRRKYGDPLDAGLSAAENAIKQAARRMIEEGLYWPLVQIRWADDEGFAHVRRILAPLVPRPLRFVALPMIRKQNLDNLYAQGTGRHTRNEIYDLGKRDVTSLAGLLGDRPFMLGDAPTSLDATAWAFVLAIAAMPNSTPLGEHVRAQANLMSYLERMRQKYWNDSPAVTLPG